MREQNCCLLKIWKHFRKDKHGSLVIYFTPFQSHLSLYYSLIPTFVLSRSVNPMEPDYLCYQYSLCVKSLQSCPTLCDLMDCSPPGSSVHGILQARRLNCVAIPFSRGPSQPKDWTQISCTAGSFITVWATREAQIAEMRVKQPSSMSPDTCHTQKSTKFLNLRYPGFPSLTIISDVQIICLLCCKPSASCSAVSDSLWHHELYSPSGSSVHGIFQARMLECCQALLQEIFPTQGSNLGLQHCRQILSEPPGKPLRHTLPYNLTSSPASPEKFSQDYLRRCLPGLKS